MITHFRGGGCWFWGLNHSSALGVVLGLKCFGHGMITHRVWGGGCSFGVEMVFWSWDDHSSVLGGGGDGFGVLVMG